MARRDREINIFNIAFLDVITGAMGAFVLLVLLLAPYYSGSAPRSQANQEAAQSAVSDAQKNLRTAQQSVPQDDQQAQQALAQAKADLDKAKQQLDALKRQLDQLTSQNDRLNKLDQQQQQQIQQSTKEALDRAEQNMQQADKAVQTGNVEELKRLLAQARADLAAARKELDALNQELKEAQDENAALQAQVDRANATIEDLRRQLQEALTALAQTRAQLAQIQQVLAAAQQQRDQAIRERDQWRDQASRVEQILDHSMPVPKRWVLVDASAEPPCGSTDFTANYRYTLPDGLAALGFGSEQDAERYTQRGVITLDIIPFGSEPKTAPPSAAPSNTPYNPMAAVATALSAQFYHHELMLTVPFPEVQVYFGFRATSAPPAGCSLTVKFMMVTQAKGNSIDYDNWQSGPLPVGTQPVLFAVIRPKENATMPSPADIAAWNKMMQPSAPSSPGGKP